MIAALSNHFSRLLSPRFYLSSVVKTARCLSVRADCNVHSRMLYQSLQLQQYRQGFKHIIIRGIISHCQDKIISGGKQKPVYF